MTKKDSKLLEQIRSQENSAVVVAKARYLASVEERVTVLCFLADQEIGLGPRKTRKPVVERRLVGSLAQSASENTVSVKGPGVKEIPRCKVPSM